MKLTSLLLVLFACAAVPTQAASSAVVETRFSEQCPLASREATLRLFDDETSWQRFNAQESLPAFTQMPDWRHQRIIIVTAGMRSTPGYSLTLKTSRLRRSDQTLLLEIIEQAPAENTLQSEVLTQPCLAILLRKPTGDTIEVNMAGNGKTLTIRSR
jgi:hypothetical protein